MFFQQFRIYIVVAVVALLSWWQVKVIERGGEKLSVIEKNSADYFSIGYSKKEMDDAGMAKNLLLADSMTHYSGDGTTHLDKPVMTLFNDDVPPWVIRAESGILLADGENLLLNGKVYIYREESEGIKPLTVNTSDLRVKLPTNYAETDKWAEIISPPNRTIGTGMKVTFVEPIHLRLLSKVKGRYEVN